jgi:hypothetical protein
MLNWGFNSFNVGLAIGNLMLYSLSELDFCNKIELLLVFDVNDEEFVVDDEDEEEEQVDESLIPVLFKLSIKELFNDEVKLLLFVFVVNEIEAKLFGVDLYEFRRFKQQYTFIFKNYL